MVSFGKTPCPSGVQREALLCSIWGRRTMWFLARWRQGHGLLWLSDFPVCLPQAQKPLTWGHLLASAVGNLSLVEAGGVYQVQLQPLVRSWAALSHTRRAQYHIKSMNFKWHALESGFPFIDNGRHTSTYSHGCENNENEWVCLQCSSLGPAFEGSLLHSLPPERRVLLVGLSLCEHQGVLTQTEMGVGSLGGNILWDYHHSFGLSLTKISPPGTGLYVWPHIYNSFPS